MRKKIEHYKGYDTKQEVITKINAISFKRNSEGSYGLLYDDYSDFVDLCECNNLIPEETHITLGEDWFIVYAEYYNCIELVEWVSLDNVENKFTQTIEMFNEIKNILLASQDRRIFCLMKHNTSYKFYHYFLTQGFFEEYENNILMDPCTPDIEKLLQSIAKSYSDISEFLKDENRDPIQEEQIEDYIYHETSFEITDKFIKRYKK